MFFIQFKREFFGAAEPTGKHLGQEEVEVNRRADRVRVEAGGDGDAGGGFDPADGDFGVCVLPLEEGVWRAWRR